MESRWRPQVPTSAHHEPQGATLELPGMPPSPKNHENLKENLWFCDVLKVTLGGLSEALFPPSGLPMSPKVAQKEHQGAQRDPFGDNFSLIFRTCSALDARWGPKGCPSALRHPKVIQNWPSRPQNHAQKTLQNSKISDKLSNPNAKNCKEPCNTTEPPKRTKTLRCGGVASAFSII